MASMAAKWLTSKLGGDFIPSDSLDMLSNGLFLKEGCCKEES